MLISYSDSVLHCGVIFFALATLIGVFIKMITWCQICPSLTVCGTIVLNSHAVASPKLGCCFSLFPSCHQLSQSLPPICLSYYLLLELHVCVLEAPERIQPCQTIQRISLHCSQWDESTEKRPTELQSQRCRAEMCILHVHVGVLLNIVREWHPLHRAFFPPVRRKETRGEEVYLKKRPSERLEQRAGHCGTARQRTVSL